MNSIEIRRKIEDKLIENGWGIVSYGCNKRDTITCRKAFATVDITYEMCSCHGGRIWISETNHNHAYWTIDWDNPICHKKITRVRKKTGTLLGQKQILVQG